MVIPQLRFRFEKLRLYHGDDTIRNIIAKKYAYVRIFIPQRKSLLRTFRGIPRVRVLSSPCIIGFKILHPLITTCFEYFYCAGAGGCGRRTVGGFYL